MARGIATFEPGLQADENPIRSMLLVRLQRGSRRPKAEHEGAVDEGPGLFLFHPGGARAKSIVLSSALASAMDVYLFIGPEGGFDADEMRHEPEKAWPLSEEMRLIAASLRLYVELYPLEHSFLENAMELIGYSRRLDPDNWEAWTEYVRITRAERQRAMARARKARAIVTKVRASSTRSALR